MRSLKGGLYGNGPAATLKPRHNLPMNSSRRHFRSGLKLFFAAAIVWTSSNATAAGVYVPFAGEKTTWHEGFDRYDFIMDDATGAITPIKAPASEGTSFGIDDSVKDWT